jgi:cyclopropane-fatty-acyl-phospholipid synthase
VVLMPDGAPLAVPSSADCGGANGSRDRLPVLQLHEPDAFFERLSRDPKLGIGEGYVAGEWSPGPGTDLADALTPFAARLTTLLPARLMRLRRLLDQPLPSAQRNTLTGARSNIAAHYDLSNELFAQFLDPSMTYSAALFDDARPWGAQTLLDAQERKIDAVLDLAGVGPGRRVLEIGTGWGSLALRAAARGAQVTSVTLSAEQAMLARRRAHDAGLGRQVDIRVEDYREVRGSYDSVVSVEMIEAVGEEYWPEFFRTLAGRVAPDGRIALQSILMAHDRMLATRHSYGWIQKYIFPGGLIPSQEAIEAHAGSAGLRLSRVDHLGPHYAETLRRWRTRFTRRWTTIASSGFDDRFRRTWEFYLAYSEAGFASGYLDVAQLQLRHGDERR